MQTASDETIPAAPDNRPGPRRLRRSSSDAEPGLREYVALLRRHWWVALATFTLVLLAALASTWLTQPVYRAEAEVLLRTERSAQLFPRTSATTSDALTRSPIAELEYTASDTFQDAAQAAAGADVEVEVRSDLAGESSTLVFVAEDDDPEVAARAANAWASTYVAQRHERDRQEVDRLWALLTADRAAVDQQLRERLQPLAALDQVIAAETDPTELSQLLNQRLALERSLAVELDPLEDELQQLNEQISALEVDGRVLQDPAALAFVSSAAERPDSPVNQSLVRNLAVGVLAGLIFAAVAVAVARALRDRVSTSEELEQATGLPVLARVARDRGTGDRTVEVTSRPRSAASEAYRALLTSIESEARHARTKRLLVTSTGDREGATAVALNLAALAGQSSTSVLVVALDLRDSRLHTYLGLDNALGVTDVLAGAAETDDALRQVELPGSRICALPAGPPADDPALLLRSARSAALFGDDVRQFDLVIYVGAPLLSYVDSLIVARSVDAALLVVPSGAHPADDVATAADRLVSTGTRTLGVVLTNARD